MSPRLRDIQEVFCIAAGRDARNLLDWAAFRPGVRPGLLRAVAGQFVFYSEFFFLKAYNNFLIWMGAGDLVFDCLFELGMTVLKVIDQIHSSHTVLLKASPKQ